MQNIKLVLTDIDGTLLNSNHEVTEKTIEAIKALKKQGILFGIASGRPYLGVAKKIVDWKIEEYVDVLVTMNGVQLWDKSNNQHYQYFVLNKEYIKEILEEYAFLKLNPCFYVGNVLHCVEADPRSVRTVKNNALELKTVPVEEFYKENREKIFFTMDPSRMNEVETYYQNTHKESSPYKGLRSQADLFEFIDTRVSKSFGISEFCKMHGFTLNEVCAFGDTTNDIEMLRDCGVGVCMANGTDDAKSVSDVITLSNDEDGVADYIFNKIVRDN